MKKLLLVLSMCVFSLLMFAQTSIIEIPFSDGNTYSFAETAVSLSAGDAILVPDGSFRKDTACWDLTSYSGLEFSFTCSQGTVADTIPLRLVMVDTETLAAISVVKNVIFSDTTVVVSFDFDEDCSGSYQLWGIKINWGGMTCSSPVLINSINAMPIIEYTSIEDIEFSDGVTYSFAETAVSLSAGGAILVPDGSFRKDTACWNFEDYFGIEFTMTCSSGTIADTIPLRLVMVDTTTLEAVSVVKNFIFSDTTVVVSFDFDEDCSGSYKLWGIKINWGGMTCSSPVLINSINLMSVLSDDVTAIDEVKYESGFKVNQDRNRLVKVYNLNGQMVRNSVRYFEATIGLKKGIYIVDREKVYVSDRY